MGDFPIVFLAFTCESFFLKKNYLRFFIHIIFAIQQAYYVTTLYAFLNQCAFCFSLL